jgi:hypothetical protein
MLSFKKTVISALILGVSASVAVPQAHALLAVVQPVPAMALEIVGACTGSALMIDSIWMTATCITISRSTSANSLSVS